VTTAFKGSWTSVRRKLPLEPSVAAHVSAVNCCFETIKTLVLPRKVLQSCGSHVMGTGKPFHCIPV